MKAREGVMSNPEFGEKLNQLYPVVEPEMSDSGCLDNVVEFLGLFTLFVYFYTTAISVYISIAICLQILCSCLFTF